MAAALGEKVMAIQSANAKEIRTFGLGTYQGRHNHPEYGIPNPCIKLDSGKEVWGLECWWGNEEKMRAKFAIDFPDAVYVTVEPTPSKPSDPIL